MLRVESHLSGWGEGEKLGQTLRDETVWRFGGCWVRKMGVESWQACSSENRTLMIQILKSHVLSLARNTSMWKLKYLGPITPPAPPNDNAWRRTIEEGSLKPIWCLLALGRAPSWGR